MAVWIVKRGTLERQIPDTATLLRLARNKRLQATDQVFHPDRQQWLGASEVPEISQAFTEAEPLPTDGWSSSPPLQGAIPATTSPSSGSTVPAPDIAPETAPQTEANEEAGRATTAIPERNGTMRSPLSVVLVVLLLSCVSLLAWPLIRPAAHTQAPTRWEYSIVAIPDTRFEADMNKLGEAGWELVFARRASDGSSYKPEFSYEVILKRPKQSATIPVEQ